MLRTRAGAVRVPLKVVIGLAVLRGLGRLTKWMLRALVRYFAALVVLAALGYVAWRAYDLHPYAPAGVAVGVLVALVGWRAGHVGSFRRWLAWPVRAWWRRLLVYGVGWEQAMQSTGLTKKLGDTETVPRILRLRSTATVDELTIRLAPGQVLEDFAAQAHRLASMFEALDCRVRSHPRSRRKLVLWFLITDPLAAPVDLLPVPDKPNLARLPVAVREDSLTYRLRLLATHLLIVGATGAGKGSVLWSIIRAAGPLVRDRLVELWVLDPKGGMELTFGARLFTRFCYGDDQPRDAAGDLDEGLKRVYELTFAEFLEDAVTEMHARQTQLRGVSRQHKPEPGFPAILVIIDELASLTAYVVDREAKKRIAAALALLLSQGRAVGVYVIAALQDPRKEVLPDRGLFPTRIAMRVNEAEDVDLTLGKQARERGAACHQIADTTPGIAYVAIDGVPEPVRVRFGFVSDDEINTLCALYAPGTTVPNLRLVGTNDGGNGGGELTDPTGTEAA